MVKCKRNDPLFKIHRYAKAAPVPVIKEEGKKATHEVFPKDLVKLNLIDRTSLPRSPYRKQ